MLNPQAWHERFQQQARWTEPVRRFLFSELGLAQRTYGLEVGCGSGVIASETHQWGVSKLFGIDIRLDFIQLARQHSQDLLLSQADALQLPFQAGSFDFVFCHYFLLWLARPDLAVIEMRRVTRPGHPVLIMAEPDYGGRIDYPDSLEKLGRLQAESLSRQGADPQVGRKLASLLISAGLRQVHSGVLGGQWGGKQDETETLSEWMVLNEDLAGQVPDHALGDFQAQDRAARQSGERILYIPTFYAWGTV
jgi:SAM-dependent methyltransferase